MGSRQVESQHLRPWWASVCWSFLLLTVACGPTPEPISEVPLIVMQPGEGEGARADEIASSMIGPAPAGGQAPILVSAEHVAWIEAPARRVDFVFSRLLVRGKDTRCLVVWNQRFEADGNSGGGSSFCDAHLPAAGVVLDSSSGGGPLRTLLILTTPETESVEVETSSGAKFTVHSAGGIAYIQWPSARGDGVSAIGRDAQGNELWTQPLPTGGQ